MRNNDFVRGTLFLTKRNGIFFTTFVPGFENADVREKTYCTHSELHVASLLRAFGNSTARKIAGVEYTFIAEGEELELTGMFYVQKLRELCLGLSTVPGFAEIEEYDLDQVGNCFHNLIEIDGDYDPADDYCDCQSELFDRMKNIA